MLHRVTRKRSRWPVVRPQAGQGREVWASSMACGAFIANKAIPSLGALPHRKIGRMSWKRNGRIVSPRRPAMPDDAARFRGVPGADPGRRSLTLDGNRKSIGPTTWQRVSFDDVLHGAGNIGGMVADLFDVPG